MICLLFCNLQDFCHQVVQKRFSPNEKILKIDSPFFNSYSFLKDFKMSRFDFVISTDNILNFGVGCTADFFILHCESFHFYLFIFGVLVIRLEGPTSQVHPRCANTINCLKLPVHWQVKEL